MDVGLCKYLKKTVPVGFVAGAVGRLFKQLFIVSPHSVIHAVGHLLQLRLNFH